MTRLAKCWGKIIFHNRYIGESKLNMAKSKILAVPVIVVDNVLSETQS